MKIPNHPKFPASLSDPHRQTLVVAGEWERSSGHSPLLVKQKAHAYDEPDNSAVQTHMSPVRESTIILTPTPNVVDGSAESFLHHSASQLISHQDFDPKLC